MSSVLFLFSLSLPFFLLCWFSERPKIRLPRQLRTKYIKRVGEKINLVIPFQVSKSTIIRPFTDGSVGHLYLNIVLKCIKMCN